MEQLHPCVKCGACCAFYRVIFHWSETLLDSFQVPVSMTLDVSPHLNAMKGTNQPDPRCVALDGNIGGHAVCRIYEHRPSCCRNFKPSYEDGTHNERCDQARIAKGLAPLTLEDWPRPYIPGINARPDYEEPIAEKIDPNSSDRNEIFQRGLDLFRTEYYWESHIYFEALWKAHDRQGIIADLLKALIKLAAAGVNLKQGQWDRAKSQLKRAEELLLDVQRLEGDSFLGLDLSKIIRSIKEMPASPQQVAGTFCRIL